MMNIPCSYTKPWIGKMSGYATMQLRFYKRSMTYSEKIWMVMMRTREKMMMNGRMIVMETMAMKL